MRTINCTITTIAEALRANGLQIIASTLVVSRVPVVSVRGLYGLVERGYAHLLRHLGLLVPAMAPTGPAMLKDRHRQGCKRQRLSDFATALRWSADRQAAGSPGHVSRG